MKDPNFLDFIRQRECSYCGSSGGNQAHHLRIGSIGTSRKPSDYAVLPLCFHCHDFIHNDPELFKETLSLGDMCIEVVKSLNEFNWNFSSLHREKKVKIKEADYYQKTFK